MLKLGVGRITINDAVDQKDYDWSEKDSVVEFNDWNMVWLLINPKSVLFIIKNLNNHQSR